MYSKSGSRVIGNLKPDSYNDEVMSKLKRMVAGSRLYQITVTTLSRWAKSTT